MYGDPISAGEGASFLYRPQGRPTSPLHFCISTCKLHIYASLGFDFSEVDMKPVAFLLYNLAASLNCLLSTFRIGHQTDIFSTFFSVLWHLVCPP